MGYFPLCIDLKGKTVLLVGDGPQIQNKREKLSPFGANVVQVERLTEEMLGGLKGALQEIVKEIPDEAEKETLIGMPDELPALVIVGDTDMTVAEDICTLCAQYNIPVNVVDVPRMCTFFFPSLIVNGDLTVSVSTGGKSPAAAALLRRRMESQIPDRVDEILEWLHEQRAEFREKGILKEATAMAFEWNRPLSEDELQGILQQKQCKTEEKTAMK